MSEENGRERRNRRDFVDIRDCARGLYKKRVFPYLSTARCHSSSVDNVYATRAIAFVDKRIMEIIEELT